MRGGMRASPADKLGVATISAGVQRAGGSTKHPSEVMDAQLEEMAAYIEEGAGGETIQIEFGCLKEDSKRVLSLLSEVVQAPALPQPKIELYKKQIVNVLGHANDSAGSIPPRELAKLMYGRNSVFARSSTPASVSSITRDDLLTYLSAWERPDSSILGICGDFDSSEIKAWVLEYFGAWQPSPGQPAKPRPLPFSPLPAEEAGAYTGLGGGGELTALTSGAGGAEWQAGLPQGIGGVAADTERAPNEGKIFLVDRPGAGQASIALGEVGVALADPDVYALDVLGDILNSFGGRLFDQIRSRQGLAYSVSGGWSSTPVDHPGLFAAGGQTSKPGEFLQAMQRVLQEATLQAPSLTEVEDAKARALNAFVFNFASSQQQLTRALVTDLLDLPQDFLEQYRVGVAAVTPEQVLAAAQRHLHPDRQAIVIAADAQAVGPQLAALGRQVVPLKLES